MDRDGIVLRDVSEALDCALELAIARITNPHLICDWGAAAYEVEGEEGREVLILSMASVLGRMTAHADAPPGRWVG